MKIILIRHAQTPGNLEKRYIGKTDEPLSEYGKQELSLRTYPECEAVFVSPMRRCIQTADIIYPQTPHIICTQLRECDFGDFEQKNHKELSESPSYQAWLQSGGTAPFPNGENPASFKVRCTKAFASVIAANSEKSCIAFVVHGGTIMSVMEAYARPRLGYFDYMVPNCCGYLTVFNGEFLTVTEKL